jgi:hypothetical protein
MPGTPTQYMYQAAVHSEKQKARRVHEKTAGLNACGYKLATGPGNSPRRRTKNYLGYRLFSNRFSSEVNDSTFACSVASKSRR